MVYNRAYGVLACVAGRFPLKGNYTTKQKPLICKNQGLFQLRAANAGHARKACVAPCSPAVRVLRACRQPPRAAFLVVSLPTSPMPLLQDVTLGIDFGTSNSAMAVRQGAGLSRMVALEGNAPTLPTALFFNA